MTGNDWHLPETAVYDRIERALDDGDPAVLATVVDVEGSAYRRPGARMLVRPSGGGAGSITAGCLETEVRDLAAEVLRDGAPRVETWDLSGDDDDVWGLGVGCNGVITVLLEPLGSSVRPVVEAHRRGEPVGVATVIDGDSVGERACYRPAEGVLDGAVPGVAGEWLAEQLADAVESGDAGIVEREGRKLFVEGLAPPPELVVFGSGHDVVPVVELAARAEFRTTVVTFRGARADGERFGAADEVVSASPGEVGDLRDWDADSYAVVMTHNFVDDRIAVSELLDTPVPYVGVMGPDERFAELREALADEGRPLAPDERERLYAPVGLNLGGDTPNRIALSIVSELVAVANDREPGHLRRHDGPIHGRSSDAE